MSSSVVSSSSTSPGMWLTATSTGVTEMSWSLSRSRSNRDLWPRCCSRSCARRSWPVRRSCGCEVRPGS
eukprot:9474961-Pyramimonas_sp.AAC.1